MVQLLKPPWMSPQTFQCTVFSVYGGIVIEEQRHTMAGSEQTDPSVQILLWRVIWPGMGDKAPSLL